ncbi:MAG: O-antigen ligase family protein [Dehalococcoidia bacterium]
MEAAARAFPVFPTIPIRGAGLVLACGSVAAALVLVVGTTAVVAVFGIGVLAGLFLKPRAGAHLVLGVAIALDPGGFGFFHLFADPFWKLPPSVADALPLKTNPFELLVAWLAVVVTVRGIRAASPGLPGLVWLVPCILFSGLAWGAMNGGDVALAYHEARGLIFATLAFYVLIRVGPPKEETLTRAAFVVFASLACATILRWVLYLRGGAVPLEHWFDHETGLFLALGFVVACVAALQAKTPSGRAAAVGLALLTLVAVAMTGRRSAILGVGAGVLIVGWLVMPKRPALLVGLAVPALLVMAGYLSVYWEGHTGPLAEPARAVRSQVDPDARDRSSDEYRTIERENVQRTLRGTPLFGVGFGNPYEQFEKLPTLALWPLQFHTPHQNLLWLWLKMGIVGAAVLVGLWITAFRRCVIACRSAAAGSLPAVPLCLAAGLLMALTYARVDMAFVGSRSAVFCAVLLALAFQFVGRDGRPQEGPQ